MEGFYLAIENPSREEVRKNSKKGKRIAVVGLSDNPERTSIWYLKPCKMLVMKSFPLIRKRQKFLVRKQ